MCGIVGVFVPRGGAPVDPAVLRRMADAIRHRGPDDDGFHVEDGVGLGFRRLSIIDLDGGHQPLFNEDGAVGVVFNGEIYNFRELRRELEQLGHQFRTRADSEVLVHGWESWGTALPERLRGMFAFAVWDRRRRTLFLARDRLGIKPLHLARLPDGRVLFASELKALLVEPALSRQIDPAAVEEYFGLGYVPDPRSILAGVEKLSPGHRLLLGEGPRAVPERYWDVRFTAVTASRGNGDETEALLARLDDAVASHLVSDVPVGAFLSGGIDSSAVVGSMRLATVEVVRTYSITFAEGEFDEGRFARQVAAFLGTHHREERASADGFRLLPQIVAAYDEPFSDSSAIPTYLLCQLARQEVKVALSGDGGDETLAGYSRYLRQLTALRARDWLPGPLRAVAHAGARGAAAWLGSRAERIATAVASLEGDEASIYLRLVGVSEASQRAELFSASFQRALQGHRAEDRLRDCFAQAPADDPLSRVQYVDLKTYLPGEILTKVDRASMAHSLEVRVPLLDHQWVEWAATLPRASRLRGGVGKHVLRQALSRRLPAGILARRKHGFSVPVAAWLRGPLRGEMERRLLGSEIADTGFFEPQAVARLVRQHLDGSRDQGALLWALLMFQEAWERISSP
jgi:asparagine synthase (glutamine-hydrolysing)